MPDNIQYAELAWWRQKPVWIMLFLGFSAGIPILLIFSSLSLWLREAGVDKSTVTFFSWAALGYSFKFIWAPIIDKLPLPILSALLGRRRGWLLFSQFAIIAAIALMALTDPKQNLTMMALAALALGFSSATQDIVIDAFRIESADARLQAMLSSTYVAGYRVGMIVAGAGALYLAEWFGSSADVYSYEAWRYAYLAMGLVMLVGVITTLLISEPDSQKTAHYPYATTEYIVFFVVFLCAVAAVVMVFLVTPSAPELTQGYLQTLFKFCYGSFVFLVALLAGLGLAYLSILLGLINRDLAREAYWEPIFNFLKRYGHLAFWVLLLVGFYRVSDIVMGVIANVFYQDMGYTKSQIASVTKVFGVIMTIAGSFLGGLLALRIGVIRVLLLGATLVALTNLLFMWLAGAEPKTSYLAVVIAADNISAGIAVAAFIAWLSSLTSVSFTATQYALFSSLMTLFPKLIGGYSGTLVEQVGYSHFFLIASVMGVPVIALILILRQRKLI